MSRINEHIGGRICMYRKARELTLQQLADLIHKSRASVSKYEMVRSRWTWKPCLR